jgi:hypothetical protein
MGNHRNEWGTQMGTIGNIDSLYIRSKILSNMFRDRASILMEAKAKRKPTSATPVVGFGLVSVDQEIKKIK